MQEQIGEDDIGVGTGRPVLVNERDIVERLDVQRYVKGGG